jgi:exo-1,4-beta-D-glucosaminidase
VYSLVFKGINYRADIWLNGNNVATHSQAVGMYNEFEFNVTGLILPGASNVLAVKVIPERALAEDVELADSWLDWINWKYLGYQDAENNVEISFVPDRNAGIWKRVFLRTTGGVTIRHPYVATDLPPPALSPAVLTVYCDISNEKVRPYRGRCAARSRVPASRQSNFKKKFHCCGIRRKRSPLPRQRRRNSP